MKIYLIIFLFFYSWVQLIAQDRLVIKQISFGGPTIIPHNDITEFIFKRKDDKFIIKKYLLPNTVHYLQKKYIISVSKVDSILNPKTPIYFKDLGFTIEDIRETVKSMHVTILPQTLDLLKPDFVLNFDSLNFCRSNLFEVLYGRSMCGGTNTEVRYNKNRLFYYPDSYSGKEFDIKMYLKVYILIKDLPGISNYLSTQHLKKGDVLHWFIRFLEMFQCEDYYYRLYLKDNPPKDSLAKRKRTGWNFEEYLKKIKSNIKN